MASSYEITINVSHISTSPRARTGVSSSEAVSNAKGSLKYITRIGAGEGEDIIVHSDGVTLRAERDADKSALIAMTHDAIDARIATERPDTGIRLADKLIISLPRDATSEEHRKMVERILQNLGGDSEAWLIAAIHRDKLGNPHLHILGIDGRETREHAELRSAAHAAAVHAAGKRPRIRCGDHMRLNEGGNRQDLRARIAHEINAVGQPAGRRFAEHRSYESRGVSRPPGRHIGNRKRAIEARATEVFGGFLSDMSAFDDDPTSLHVHAKLPTRTKEMRPYQILDEAEEDGPTEQTR